MLTAIGREVKDGTVVISVAAGVPIEPDFVLSEVRPNGEQKIIADEAHVHLKAGDEFWAIPGDDNS